jgi:transmembrane sensor
MSPSESAAETARIAADWAVRHPLSAADAAALEQWLAGDPRRAGALLRAQAGWAVLDRGQALRGDRATSAAPPAAWLHRMASRRAAVIGIGGSLAATVIGVVSWPLLSRQRATTTRGEIRRLPLEDGSIATINTESELEMSVRANLRKVALVRGQAWFEVVKDNRRPFVVDAGIAQVRAVGTAFAVHRHADRVEIAVTEGTVAAWHSSAEGDLTVLTAGQVATFRGDAAPVGVRTAPEAIRRSLAWRDGEIVLEGETLASAVAQFNRYNRRQLVIEDAALGREPLVGLFQIGDPEGFAATVATTVGAQVYETADEIRLSAKKSDMRETEAAPPRI